MPTDKSVIYSKNANVATVTLNRPEKCNAFTRPMIDAWHQSLLDAEADPNVRVIVLTGAGKAFCAGADIAQKDRSEQNGLERKNHLFRNVHRIALLMQRIDKPSIAAINGAARGAGFDMALMCDLRIMARSATLAESYINIGLIAGDGGAYYLPRLIGMPRALELFWTGRVVSAEEAEKIGIVNGIVDDDQLMDSAYKLARAIAAQPFEAIRTYKRAAYQGLGMSLEAHLDLVSSHLSVLRDTKEHRDKVAAFLHRKRT